MSALEKSKLFSGLLTQELHALAQTAEMRAFKAGQNIFQEGDPGDGMFVIVEGLVQVSALISEGQRRIVLTQVKPGDFFGEMAVLDDEPRSATATAEIDTKTFFIRRGDLLKVLEQSPKLAVGLMREFSRRMRDSNRHYIQEVLQAERLTLVGRFARSIVHDFKNPLNVIGLAAEMMGMDQATPEMRASAQQRIRKQVDRLSNMINELLEFTRGSQATNVLAQADYSLFVHHLVEDFQLEVAARAVTIELPEPPSEVSVLIDQQRLSHVFYNLIHNAVHEMPEGGKIFLRFHVLQDEVITEVEDTGKGIAPEIATRLFEPFATHGKAQGTGLGLSICKKIIEDHKGKISARSEPGHGAVFSFSLPLSR